MELGRAAVGGAGMLTFASHLQAVRDVWRSPGNGHQGGDYKGLRVNVSAFAYPPRVLYLKFWLYWPGERFALERRDGPVPITTTTTQFAPNGEGSECGDLYLHGT